jgi:phenylalanyl-tRNA synthetase alpha chain
MKNKLEQLKQEILEQLQTVKDSQLLQEIENKYLGRKGELNNLLKSIKDLEEKARQEVGQFANEVKNEINSKFYEIKNRFGDKANAETFLDVTLPGENIPHGHLHPITIIQKELEELFKSMGFMILDGPELESDYYNFEALNIPAHHPARDMQDTFYIDKKNKDGNYDLLMRTHTSPMQVRAMQKYGAPLRGIIPGRVFRSEATDVRHEHTFYQLEGLMIGKGINFSHLKGVLELIGQKLYGENTKLRMRPKFYPFVEPGSNGEYTCFLCQGKGCRLCKNTGWLEIVGCGMIHPEVLIAGGINPQEYSGFAFGFGLNRLVMLKYGIDDIRLFNGGDVRFLEQF